MLPIVSHIPAPKTLIERYPLPNLAIGQSFLAPKPPNVNNLQTTLYAHARRRGMKLRTRCDENGDLRVWRIA